MKVLLGLTYFRPHISGLTIYVERLGRALAERGHEVTVLTSRYDRALPRRERHDGMEVVRVPVAFRVSKGVVMPTYGLEATRQVLSHDVLSVHLPQLDAWGLALRGRLLRRPCVLTYHCDLQLPAGRVNRAAERVVAAANGVAGRFADTVVAYTADYAEHSPFLRAHAGKLEVVGPPVVMPEPRAEAVAAFREAHWHAPGDGPLIGFAARFAAEKGVDALLRALPAVRERHPGVTVLFAGPHEAIVGEEAYRARLAPAIDALGDRWRFLGPLDPLREMPAFFGAIDCLVVPSVNSTESFGLVQVEAMLCGTPVVASDLPGVRQPVRLTGMGEIAAPGDPGSLAAGVLRVLAEPARYVRPRAEIAARFDPERTTDAYETIFARLLDATGRPRPAAGSTPPDALLRRLTIAALGAVPAPLVAQARVSRGAPVAERVGRLALRPLRGAPVPVRTGPAHGLELRAETRSLAWLTGKVEREVQRVFVDVLRPGDHVVDAGASVGFFALLAARLVGPGGRVVAFEPDPAEAAALRANAAHNGLDNVEVAELALAREIGTAYLDRPGAATARLVTGPRPGALEVATTSLDSYLAARPELAPALVKIDVEGAEADVLAGMAVTLARMRPTLVVEQHGDTAFLAALAAAGYSARPLEAASLDDAPWWAHVLAVPDAD